MIKSIKTIMRQDREPYRIPRRVQDVIPIQCVWPDGIFKVGIKFSKTYRFTDINYKVASREDKETMFLAYSELLNSLDSAATTKLTICNRRQSQADFEQSVLMSMRGDGLDKYRKEYICPDGIEKHSNYLKLGDRYCRVLFLKDYANYTLTTEGLAVFMPFKV